MKPVKSVTPTMTLRTLIDKLVAQNLLEATLEPKIVKTLEVSPTAPLPWVAKVLMGISAWLATMFLLIFMGLAHLVDSTQTAIILGALLVVSTVTLQRWQHNQLFLSQLWLALNLTGQILFIGGTGLETDIRTAALIALALTSLLIIIYQDTLLRFISVLIATLALVILVDELAMPQAIHLVSFGLAVGATWCWLGEPYHLTHAFLATLYRPLGYGLTVALQLLLLLSINAVGHYYLYSVTWWLSTVGLTVLLLTVEYQLLETNQVNLLSAKSTLILLGTLAVAGILYQSPGIIASLIITLIAFQRGNRVLLGLAIAFFTTFLIAYYYHLELTLLAKSIALMLGGVTLLGLRWLLKHTWSTAQGGN